MKHGSTNGETLVKVVKRMHRKPKPPNFAFMNQHKMLSGKFEHTYLRFNMLTLF